jgi:hypothetical protein
MSFTGMGSMFFSAVRRPFSSRRRRASIARGCSEESQARVARTILVQDAVRPYLAGAEATKRRDFHKLFHSLCGSISGTDD